MRLVAKGAALAGRVEEVAPRGDGWSAEDVVVGAAGEPCRGGGTWGRGGRKEGWLARDVELVARVQGEGRRRAGWTLRGLVGWQRGSCRRQRRFNVAAARCSRCHFPSCSAAQDFDLRHPVFSLTSRPVHVHAQPSLGSQTKHAADGWVTMCTAPPPIPSQVPSPLCPGPSPRPGTLPGPNQSVPCGPPEPTPQP